MKVWINNDCLLTSRDSYFRESCLKINKISIHHNKRLHESKDKLHYNKYKGTVQWKNSVFEKKIHIQPTTLHQHAIRQPDFEHAHNRNALTIIFFNISISIA